MCLESLLVTEMHDQGLMQSFYDAILWVRSVKCSSNRNILGYIFVTEQTCVLVVGVGSC